MKLSQQLFAAADKVASGWCQYAYATDWRNDPCSARSAKAACWCAYGALQAAAGQIVPSDTEVYLRGMLLGIGFGITAFNDAPGRTQIEVFDALWGAGEVAESEGL